MTKRTKILPVLVLTLLLAGVLATVFLFHIQTTGQPSQLQSWSRTPVRFYPLSNSIIAGGSADEKFLAMVNEHDTDIRWMYTEISNGTPSALEIIRGDLYNMIASDLTPVEAAQNLQNGLGEWYVPAQSCK